QLERACEGGLRGVEAAALEERVPEIELRRRTVARKSGQPFVGAEDLVARHVAQLDTETDRVHVKLGARRGRVEPGRVEAPGCLAATLGLEPAAFEQIADRRLGLVAYRRVAERAVIDPIAAASHRGEGGGDREDVDESRRDPRGDLPRRSRRDRL